MAKSKRRPAKKQESKKKNSLNVSFAEDIPKISREGTERKSKYDTLLDKIRERAESNPDNSVAVLQFDSTGQATSRYTSVKTAAQKREDADHWEVAVRTHDEDDVRLYIKFHDEAQESEEDETEDTEPEEEEEEQEDDEEEQDDDTIEF